jgi:hypothetical protein
LRDKKQVLGQTSFWLAGQHRLNRKTDANCAVSVWAFEQPSVQHYIEHHWQTQAPTCGVTSGSRRALATAMTKRGRTMKWDQIESKWALMTRRIRADFRDERSGSIEASAGTLKRHDAHAAKIAESQTAAVSDSEFKTSAR